MIVMIEHGISPETAQKLLGNTKRPIDVSQSLFGTGTLPFLCSLVKQLASVSVNGMLEVTINRQSVHV